MATVQVSSPLGQIRVVDKRNAYNTGASPISTTAWNASGDNNDIDTQLATLNGTYYTAAMLQSMTLNDKYYALRVGYDNAGI